MRLGRVMLHPAAREARPRPLATAVGLADGWWSRLRGLMGRPPLQPGQGLWIRPCQQVHTQFMSAAIDVVFLDAEGRVLRVLPAMRPWRVSPFLRAAREVLELAAGEADGLQPGDRLVFQPLA